MVNACPRLFRNDGVGRELEEERAGLKLVALQPICHYDRSTLALVNVDDIARRVALDARAEGFVLVRGRNILERKDSGIEPALIGQQKVAFGITMEAQTGIGIDYVD